MSWTRVSALLPAALAACANVPGIDDLPDAGADPAVASVAPSPGPVEPSAAFTVTFSEPMDEGQLLAASGRSETVALAAAADVERAAAAMEHAQLSSHERELLVAASADVAPDRSALTLTPDQPLAAGGYFLLVSPRLKDDLGRHLIAARYAFQVAAAAAAKASAQLVWPAAGGEAPSNLAVVRAHADSGRLSLVGSHGETVAAADAHGAVALQLAAPLQAGETYTLSLDGASDAAQAFHVATCARDAPPALQGGAAQVSPRDTAVTASVAFDWPVHLAVDVADAPGATFTAEEDVVCAPPACGPQTFACAASLSIDGLTPGTDYLLRVTAIDDFGHIFRTAPQPFSTLSPLPNAVLTEVMASGTAGEYVEIANFGPGAADLEALALQGPDGVTRPLLAVAAPLPLILPPGARALAVGASFDASRYPALPAGTPVLRSSTQRLLGHGLSDSATPSFALVLASTVPVELSRFPGAGSGCGIGQSLQRDESVPARAAAAWVCGPQGGTPGLPP
ncbi:MAG TPA: hypothetical protein VFL36_12075 [Myxococcales bacterium]|nr:hypothetical protein [Myxococcales bacterium]